MHLRPTPCCRHEGNGTLTGKPGTVLLCADTRCSIAFVCVDTNAIAPVCINFMHGRVLAPQMSETSQVFAARAASMLATRALAFFDAFIAAANFFLPGAGVVARSVAGASVALAFALAFVTATRSVHFLSGTCLKLQYALEQPFLLIQSRQSPG